MSINLENFPDSETAKAMLSYVTQHWYDRSYVGKWTYEVMGRELDLAKKHIEELPYQFFVDSATWGLMYHELKYGLPIRTDLSYEERRKLIRERRDTKAPMTPWRMEGILSSLTGYVTQVFDINDEGYMFEHPNIFLVRLRGDEELNINDVITKIRQIKQSHTAYLLHFTLMEVENEESFIQRTTFRMPFVWWRGCFDGSFLFDGTHKFDAEYPPYFCSKNRILSTILEHFSFTTVKYPITVLNAERAQIRSIQRAEFRFFDYCTTFDGEQLFDGSMKFDQEASPLWYSQTYRTSVENGEDFGVSMYTPALDAVFDGKFNFDGTIRFNSGREEL